MTSFAMTDGYDRRKNKNEAAYRFMTIDEAKALHYGQHVEIRDRNGQARNVKVNGQPKTWKREPNRVSVPVKYGMYECDRMETQSDGTIGNGISSLVVRMELN